MNVTTRIRHHNDEFSFGGRLYDNRQSLELGSWNFLELGTWDLGHEELKQRERCCFIFLENQEKPKHQTVKIKRTGEVIPLGSCIIIPV